MQTARQEYLPYLGRVVWIRDVVEKRKQAIDGSTVPRLFVWIKSQWAERSDAPDDEWSDFRWSPKGLRAVA